ncbi:hypothetical protein [Lactococcus allomyrinae]|uniref:Uncharacterized protein n=1 Tax=Lactococcus allomyrinae TaxID=2419773 RepID=A0A387BLD7_9LACT|nr:hypothetical protein [Lactococcus allomyrinae]AYG01790.1 hypothetical protein D7I46_12435 [Lactococcus allomyrinae]
MMLGLVGMIYYFFSQIFRQTYFISGFLLAMFISISVFKSQFTNQVIFMFFSQNKSYDFPLVIKLMTFVGLILCLNAGSYELLRRRESLGERQ